MDHMEKYMIGSDGLPKAVHKNFGEYPDGEAPLMLKYKKKMEKELGPPQPMPEPGPGPTAA